MNKNESQNHYPGWKSQTQKNIYGMIPFIANSETGRINLLWQKVGQRLPGTGAGVTAKRPKGTLGSWIVACLGCGGGYTSCIHLSKLIRMVFFKWICFAACKVYLTEVYFKIKYIGILLPDQEIKSRSKTIPGKPFYCSPSVPSIFSFGKKLVFIICTNGGEQWPREFKKRITHKSFASDGSGMCFVAYLVCE